MRARVLLRNARRVLLFLSLSRSVSLSFARILKGRICRYLNFRVSYKTLNNFCRCIAKGPDFPQAGIKNFRSRFSAKLSRNVLYTRTTARRRSLSECVCERERRKEKKANATRTWKKNNNNKTVVVVATPRRKKCLSEGVKSFRSAARTTSSTKRGFLFTSSKKRRRRKRRSRPRKRRRWFCRTITSGNSFRSCTNASRNRWRVVLVRREDERRGARNR